MNKSKHMNFWRQVHTFLQIRYITFWLIASSFTGRFCYRKFTFSLSNTRVGFFRYNEKPEVATAIRIGQHETHRDFFASLDEIPPPRRGRILQTAPLCFSCVINSDKTPKLWLSNIC